MHGDDYSALGAGGGPRVSIARMKRIALVGLAYSMASAACYFFPTWVALLWPSPNAAPFVITILGPPAMLLWGAEGLKIFAWTTGVLAISATITLATAWTDPWSAVCLFWSGVTLIVWLVCGWSSFVVHFID